MQRYLQKVLFFSVAIYVGFPAFGGINTDSLKLLLPQLPDSQKVFVLCDISFGYRLENSDSALHYSTLALEVAEKIQHPKAIAQALNDQGIILADLNRYNDALSNYNKSLTIREELNDSVGMGALHSKMGVIHQKRGAFSLAIDHQLSALRIFQALGIEQYVAVCQNNIAVLHLNMGDPERSLEMHENALKTREKLGDRYGIASSYANIGNVRLALEDTAAASTEYSKAIEIFEALDDPEGLSTNLHNLGTCYLNDQPKKAVDLLQRALQIRAKMGDEKMLSSTHASLGIAFSNLGQHDLALNHYHNALQKARRAGVLTEQLNAHKQLAGLFRKTGNADSTYFYFAGYQTLKDSAFNEGLREDFAELQTLYETEQKETRIALLSEQNKVIDLQMKQKQTQFWLLGIAFVAFVIISGLFYFSYREKQRARLATEIIREREAGMKAVIQATETERERIARDLHDGVGQQLSGLKMGWQKLLSEISISQDGQQQKSEQLTRVLDETCHDVRRISHRMMPRSISKYGLIPALEDMLDKSFPPAGIKHSFEHFGIGENRFSSELELSVYRVMQELVNNVLRHAGATEVSVQLLKNSGQLIAVIEDNGRGFHRNGKPSGGIGMQNMVSRLSTINGDIHFENDRGTRATIRINLEA